LTRRFTATGADLFRAEPKAKSATESPGGARRRANLKFLGNA